MAQCGGQHHLPARRAESGVPPPGHEGRCIVTRFPTRGRPRRSKSDVAADREAAGALTPLWLTLDGPGLVPWGMVAGPDGSLYVAVDTSYQARQGSGFSIAWGMVAGPGGSLGVGFSV